MDLSLIAPCGINCITCYAYQRSKNRCVGCLSADGNKPRHCIVCKIRNCAHHESAASASCKDCEIFPCKRLKQLDKRYRTKYHSSLIQNLKDLNAIGATQYLQREEERCRCMVCGEIICIHSKECQFCKAKLPEFI